MTSIIFAALSIVVLTYKFLWVGILIFILVALCLVYIVGDLYIMGKE